MPLNLLIIISQYHPAQTPNTIRWAALIDHYFKQGHNISVLTTKRKGYPLKGELKGIKIFRAGYNTLQDYLSDILGSKTRRNEVGQSNNNYRPHVMKSIVEKIVNQTWRKTYWPDGSKLFLKPGIHLAQEIVDTENITHIISVGLPFTCHLIAQSIKRKNKAIHWHMDIEDPFSYSKEFWVNNFKRYEKKNLKAERTAFEIADTISLTNEIAKQRYDDLFFFPEKTKVIPPLFAPYKNIPFSIPLDKEKIHLGYFGSFYTGVRSPLSFLKFLKALDEKDPSLKSKIQFHFFGQQNKFSYPIFKAFPELQAYYILHGFYERDHSISAMKKMDYLINFGNSTDYHLPSKAVDFLYLKKPLVNFTSIENDAVRLFLKNYPQLLNVHLNGNESNETGAFFNFIFDKESKGSGEENLVEKYKTEAVATLYLNCLNSTH